MEIWYRVITASVFVGSGDTGERALIEKMARNGFELERETYLGSLFINHSLARRVDVIFYR